jgi:hypothetical protein
MTNQMTFIRVLHSWLSAKTKALCLANVEFWSYCESEIGKTKLNGLLTRLYSQEYKSIKF